MRYCTEAERSTGAGKSTEAGRSTEAGSRCWCRQGGSYPCHPCHHQWGMERKDSRCSMAGPNQSKLAKGRSR